MHLLKRRSYPLYESYEVNFTDELNLLIRETKLFDQLGGFDLPQDLLNVALQENKYGQYVELLQMLVDMVEHTVLL